MQVNLNRPRIDDAGPLTDADMLTGARLGEARRHNPGTVWHPHRHILLSTSSYSNSSFRKRGYNMSGRMNHSTSTNTTLTVRAQGTAMTILNYYLKS